jgi:hypothetical protein
MKVNIKKLQQGGFIPAVSFVAPFSPPQMGGSNGAMNQNSAVAGTTDLNKDLYKKLLSDGGLKNDVYAFMDTLQTGQSALPFMNQNTQNEFIKNFGRVNEVINNKKK